jgi:superfamily II DNA or RNA helicase
VTATLKWDRGTWLVEGEKPADPAVQWDDRVARWRLPAWRWRFLGGGEDPCPGLPVAPPLDTGELRDYQRAAVDAWTAAGRWGTVVLPTGAGKTRTALAAIAAHGGRALVLAPTNVLVAQWLRVLEGVGVQAGRFGEGIREERPITVATFASARAHADTLGNRFGLLVVDECHHFGGGTGDEVLEMFAAPSRLGLTATPVDGARGERLAAILGAPVFSATLETLTGTWLAPLDVCTWTLELTPAERAAYERESAAFLPACRAFFGRNRGASWTDFTRACHADEQGRAVLTAWRRSRAIVRYTTAKRRALADLMAAHAAKRVLVFAPDAATAAEIAREHLVPMIVAQIGAAERTAILERFAAGEWRVLVSARVLNEGVDVPSADTAILVGGSQGAREYIQRIGRVLRPGPDKRATVYDLVMRDTFEVGRAARHRERLDA